MLLDSAQCTSSFIPLLLLLMTNWHAFKVRVCHRTEKKTIECMDIPPPSSTNPTSSISRKSAIPQSRGFLGRILKAREGGGGGGGGD